MATVVNYRIHQATWSGTEEPTEKYIGTYGDIGGYRHSFLDNETAKDSLVDRVSHFLDDDSTFRVAQLFEKGEKASSAAFGPSSEGMRSLGKTAGIAWKFMAVGSAFPEARKAYKAWSKLSEKDSNSLDGEYNRKTTEFCQKALGAIAMNFYAVAAIAWNFPGREKLTQQAIQWGDGFDGFSNLTEIGLNLQVAVKALKLKELALGKTESAHLANYFQEEATHAMLKAAKSVCSAAGFVFAMSMVLLGFAVSPLVAAIVSLASTILAVTATMYKISMQGKDYNFWDSKCVTCIKQVPSVPTLDVPTDTAGAESAV